MVLVYEHPLSPYAQKVKIALAEKGVAFECRLPDFMSGRDDAFAAANPRLEVPALVDGDTRVFDSTIILEYIEDRWPTPPLLPVAPPSAPACACSRSCATPTSSRSAGPRWRTA